MIREFTVRAIDNCDLLTLTLDDLFKMKHEFADIYKRLIDEACLKYPVEKKLKIDTIQQNEVELARKKSALTSKLSAIFLSGLHKTMAEINTTEKTEPAIVQVDKSLSKKRSNIGGGRRPKAKSTFYNGRPNSRKASAFTSNIKGGSVDSDDDIKSKMNTSYN